MKKNAEREDLIQMLVHDEARRLNADLDHRCDERTRELQQAQTEVEAFDYCISHDLRAPLINIAGFVDLLVNHAGDTLDATSLHYLNTIATSTYRLGRMIDDLAALTRVGRADLHKISFDLEAMAQHVVDELRPLAGERDVQWSVGEMPLVHADPTLLREVLAQLASNAMKFTRIRAETRIRISARRGDQETIVSVRDNGVGFDMMLRDRLFHAFRRLHTATEFEGVGIGLARVRRIIQRHNGRTWAEAIQGTGATFHFSLPDATPVRE